MPFPPNEVTILPSATEILRTLLSFILTTNKFPSLSNTKAPGKEISEFEMSFTNFPSSVNTSIRELSWSETYTFPSGPIAMPEGPLSCPSSEPSEPTFKIHFPSLSNLAQ